MTLFDLELNSTQAARASHPRRGKAAWSFPAAVAELCIVVPTYNERDNLPELVARVSDALYGIEWEMIVVDDDSPDDTAQTVRAFGLRDPRIRAIRRVGRRGLSSACIEGMLASGAAFLALMDADLRHDPLLLREMFGVLRVGSVDMVVASRDLADGPSGEWMEQRATTWRLAVWAARLAGRLPLADPLSGYFAIRREVIDQAAPRLSGVGSKLLLDILLAVPGLRISELPVALGVRTRGESKFSPRMVWDYGVMLAQHRVGLLPGRLLAYLLIAAAALIVHAGTFWLFHELYGLGLTGAQLTAGMALCATTYALQEWLSYRRTGPWRWYLGLVPFLVSRAVGLAATILVTRALAGAGVDMAVAALAGAVALVWWNYDAVQRYGGFAR
jgi:dolichol-phosphate mannosyltransferase